MEFKDLSQVNEEIKTTNIGRGVEYAEVAQRVLAFRKLYPAGSINTFLLSDADGKCIFRAEIVDDCGHVLATGTAYEKEGSSNVNRTSYIENCETSAVGRALAFCGIGIDAGIASNEEVTKAKSQQKVSRFISEEQKAQILKEAKRVGQTEESICKWLKVKNLGGLTEELFTSAMTKMSAYPTAE